MSSTYNLNAAFGTPQVAQVKKEAMAGQAQMSMGEHGESFFLLTNLQGSFQDVCETRGSDVTMVRFTMIHACLYKHLRKKTEALREMPPSRPTREVP
jgi:hypothetical protein